MIDARDTLLERMKVDLIGPEAPDELISDRPTDRYLTGILFPPRTTISPEDDDEASDADDADAVGTALDGVKAASAFRPSSAGLSFAVEPIGQAPRLRVRVDGARYRPEGAAEEGSGSGRKRAQSWRRTPQFAEVSLDLVALRKEPAPIIDLASSGLAAVSLHCRIAPWGDSLEAWDQLAIKKGLLNDQRIHHEPLQARLQVNGFRLPPVGDEKVGREKRPRLLPAYRFPDWHVCPKCNLLQRSRFWSSEIGKPELWCPSCSSGRGKRVRKVHAIPVRFIVTCPAGHLQDFPWMSWPKHAESCSRKKPLKLIGEGAGLKGLKVHCTECKAERDLDGALSPSALGKISCDGRSPWLKMPPETCSHQPVAIQRGASNAYFPVIESALDVPPFGGSFRDMLEDFWPDIIALDDRSQLPAFVRKRIHPLWPEPGTSPEDLTARILTLLTILDNKTGDLRPNEQAWHRAWYC